jgi:diaminohydroxyphosphoribosylaminopyrimidine deaminase/5-amino-6-(5-phosphoribosylamino)uracil reductase
MGRALGLARSVRRQTSPNPWVGAVLVAGERTFEGATAPPGGPHAEVSALRAAGPLARGATLYVTLEPCASAGRTGPCAEAIVDAAVGRVVVGIEDPDPSTAGRGLARLRRAGIEVVTGVLADEVSRDLAPYLKHRRTGRPYVVLKLAATLDGRIAAPDRSSRWITGEEARLDAHRLRDESDAVLVGAGTVRADDPRLTVRLEGAGRGQGAGTDAARARRGSGEPAPARQPLRVVLGRAAPGARVQPAVQLEGELVDVLDQLGRKGVLQLLVEGGARVAYAFHQARLVDRYVFYLAPALLGGSDGLSMFEGSGAPTMAEAMRGTLVAVRRLGADLRVDLESAPADRAAAPVAGPGSAQVGEGGP